MPRRRWRAQFWWGLIAGFLLLGSGGGARAELLDLGTQVRYDLYDVKEVGLPVENHHRLTTDIGILFKRPITPGFTAISDLRINASGVADETGQQTNRNLSFNLYHAQPQYALVGRVFHTDFDSSFGPLPSTNTGQTDSVNANFFLRETHLPLMNIQYQRNSTSDIFENGPLSKYTTANWRLSSQYTLAPLTLLYDRSQSSAEFGGVKGNDSVTQRASVQYNRQLMPSLSLVGELSRSEVNTPSRFTSQTNQAIVRLEAMPFRTVAATLSYAAQSSAQQIGLLDHPWNSRTLTLGARSDILPGLSLDYADEWITMNDQLFQAKQATATRNSSLGLSAHLSEDTIFSASLTRNQLNQNNADINSRQDAASMNLESTISPTADLVLNGGWFSSDNGASGRFHTREGSIGLHDRPTTNLSFGITYRRSDGDSLGDNGTTTVQQTDDVDVDTTWVPQRTMSFTGHLTRMLSSGSQYSRQLSPGIVCRWQMNPRTNLNLNYNMIESSLWDVPSAAMLTQRFRGYSADFQHIFPGGSTLGFTYYFVRQDNGFFEWQRQMRLSFTVMM